MRTPYPRKSYLRAIQRKEDDMSHMRTIGIIGGMAWPSSVAYYELTNERVQAKMGLGHCPNIVLMQRDIAGIKKWEDRGDWAKVAEMIVNTTQRLDIAGASFGLIACNTAHKALNLVRDQIDLPMIDIVDETAREVCRQGHKTVGLLGTLTTMNDDYFKGHLTDKYGIEVITPSKEDQKVIADIGDRELSKGIFSKKARDKFRPIIKRLVANGAEAVILACTEFGLLLKKEDSPVVLIDTLAVHVEAAANASFLGTDDIQRMYGATTSNINGL